MIKKASAILILLFVSYTAFAQGQGAYHDAMGEEKSGSGSSSIILGTIVIIAIIYFTKDKKKS